jgi:DNA-binding NarL/FixJ family response regulator
MHDEYLTGKKVLLVEDEPLEAIDYRDRLRLAGAEIIGPVASVREALACIGRDKIDVAVLDHALADGNSARLQVALEGRNIPYVILTGYPSVLVRRKSKQAILAKPVPMDLLCKTVRAVCAAP